MLKKTATVFLAFALVGCSLFRESSSPKEGFPREKDPGQTGVSEHRVHISFQEVLVGYSVEGIHISATVFGKGEDCILFLGGVHGDEPGGKYLLTFLIDLLKRSPAHFHGKRIVILPVLNPDGLARGSRYNAHRVDLNRNFPAGNWGRGVPKRRSGPAPSSEPETRALLEAMDEFQPKRIISIHSDAGCVDYDGPAFELASAMAEKCRLKVRKLGANPGSLGSHAGVEKGIPIITLELLDRVRSDEDALQAWSRYRSALLEAIRFPMSEKLTAKLGKGASN